MRFAILIVATFLSIGFGQTAREAPPESATGTANSQSSIAHFRLGETYLLHKSFQQAANEFRQTLDGDLEPRWTEVWAHINLGKLFDMTGSCTLAEHEYNLALRTRDDSFGAQKEVEEYLHLHTIRPVAQVSGTTTEDRQSSGLHRPGPGVILPVLETKTQPEYSAAALRAGLEGSVLLRAVIGEDGSATAIQVTRPLGLGLEERAIEAVRKWRFRPGLFQSRPVPVSIDIAVDFFLPSRQSRWHLVGVAFHPPEGGSAPTFVNVDYPSGAGIGRTVMDDARVVNAMGRFAAVTLSFEVNEAGVPVRFRVETASDRAWVTDAIGFLLGWRFGPGEKDGAPVSVRTTIDLLWGERNLTANAMAFLRSVTNVDPESSSTTGCRSGFAQRQE